MRHDSQQNFLLSLIEVTLNCIKMNLNKVNKVVTVIPEEFILTWTLTVMIPAPNISTDLLHLIIIY